MNKQNTPANLDSNQQAQINSLFNYWEEKDKAKKEAERKDQEYKAKLEAEWKFESENWPVLFDQAQRNIRNLYNNNSEFREFLMRIFLRFDSILLWKKARYPLPGEDEIDVYQLNLHKKDLRLVHTHHLERQWTKELDHQEYYYHNQYISEYDCLSVLADPEKAIDFYIEKAKELK